MPVCRPAARTRPENAERPGGAHGPKAGAPPGAARGGTIHHRSNVRCYPSARSVHSPVGSYPPAGEPLFRPRRSGSPGRRSRRPGHPDRPHGRITPTPSPPGRASGRAPGCGPAEPVTGHPARHPLGPHRHLLVSVARGVQLAMPSSPPPRRSPGSARTLAAPDPWSPRTRIRRHRALRWWHRRRPAHLALERTHGRVTTDRPHRLGRCTTSPVRPLRGLPRLVRLGRSCRAAPV